MNCPHCNKPIVVSISKNDTAFDRSDPMQQMGYDHAKFNRDEGKRGTYKKCPYADGTDEYYRYNRGMWACLRE